MSPFLTAADTTAQTPSHPELAGQRVFMSGIGDVVGDRLAVVFARQRTRLVLQTRHPMGQAAALADTTTAQAASVRLFAGDVGNERAASERLARAALGAYGGLDLVVNFIAGGAGWDRDAGDVAQLEDIVADNLRPAQVLSRAVADHARNSGQRATIMHVCLAGSARGARFAYYAMVKSALEAMARDQARRWFSHDICVYAFLPALAEEHLGSGADAENVVQAHRDFESALGAIMLNAACGRSQWLNGLTIAIPS